MEAKIRSWLGDAATSFQYAIGGRTRIGWRAPCQPDDLERIAGSASALDGDGT